MYTVYSILDVCLHSLQIPHEAGLLWDFSTMSSYFLNQQPINASSQISSRDKLLVSIKQEWMFTQCSVSTVKASACFYILVGQGDLFERTIKSISLCEAGACRADGVLFLLNAVCGCHGRLTVSPWLFLEGKNGSLDQLYLHVEQLGCGG